MTLGVNKISFGAIYPTRNERPVDSQLTRGQRTCIAASSLLGVTASVAALSQMAKGKKYSINPKPILNTKLKDTYLYQVLYEEPEVIAMGAGSILGGLVGGFIVDERSNNTKAEIKSKAGEAMIQFANITVPIITVGQAARWGDKLEKHIEHNFTSETGKFKKGVAKLPKLGLRAFGLTVGMYAGNFLANYLKEELLDAPEDRKIKVSDLFMHWDDLCLAASFYAGDPKTVVVDGVETVVPSLGQKITHAFSRLLPLVMVSAGYQVGCKGVEKSAKKQTVQQVDKVV